MGITLDSEIKIKGQLFALHQVVAFLLARESVSSKASLEVLHGALVNQVISACSKSSEHQELAAQFEAGVSAELDSLFGMAQVFHRVMPDK